MKAFSVVVCVLVAFAIGATAAPAQSTTGIAPTLIPISGQLTTAAGDPRTGSVLLVLSLYDAKDDPAPRWVEHQTVTLDATGKYYVQFGSTFEAGLPAELFTTPMVRWVSVAVENEPEQPRMVLVSVPYASKAATADTLSGMAASDFVLTTNLADQVKAALREEEEARTTEEALLNAVSLNYLQKGNGSGGTTDSGLIEVGANVGVAVAAPSGKVEIAHSASDELAGRNQLVFSNFFGTDFFQIGLNANGSLTIDQLRNTPSNALTVSTSGNVGIGSTEPAERLRIVGSDPRARILPIAGGSQLWLGNTAHTWGIEVSGGNNNLTFWDRAMAEPRVTFQQSGNVGIGTTSPTVKLHVVGDALFSGTVSGGNIVAKYQDVAEWVDSAEPLEAGTVVIIDDAGSNRVKAAVRAYDSRVAGAVSPQPGVILGEPGEGRVLIAQSGRVKIKADARYGAIRAGDLLVSSPRKGYAMRSKPIRLGGASIHRPGTVLGKALEPLATGSGEILVLLTLQ